MRPLNGVLSAASRARAFDMGEWLTRTAGGPGASRWAYKAQRIWLTPLFRQTIKVGVPVYAGIFALGLVIQNGSAGQALAGAVTGAWETIKAQPQFAIQQIRIAGASERVRAEIRELVDAAMPLSSIDLAGSELEAALVEVAAVADVALTVAPGGVLTVEVEERPAALIWRSRRGLTLLAGDGSELGGLGERSDRPDLPLIVGDGADEDVATALRLVAAAGPIAPVMRGLVRVGGRRWDVVVEGDRRILLPETGAVEAMRRVAALHGARRLLERDVVHVDMRLPERPTVKLTSAGRSTMEMEREALLAQGSDG